MSEEEQSLKKNGSKAIGNRVFYTDINEKSEIEKEESKLHRYVDHINNKIDYAKWKQ